MAEPRRAATCVRHLHIPTSHTVGRRHGPGPVSAADPASPATPDSAANRRRPTFHDSRKRAPLATRTFDQGRAEASLTIDGITLVLRPSSAQIDEMDRLLAEFRDPNSSNYHKWIGPESYADRFGLSLADTAKIVEWLTAQHLTVANVARRRDGISRDRGATCSELKSQRQLRRTRAADLVQRIEAAILAARAERGPEHLSGLAEERRCHMVDRRAEVGVV